MGLYAQKYLIKKLKKWRFVSIKPLCPSIVVSCAYYPRLRGYPGGPCAGTEEQRSVAEKEDCKRGLVAKEKKKEKLIHVEKLCFLGIYY